MEDKLLKCLTGFRKSHGPPYLLINMVENWKKEVDKWESVSAKFMDLSKTFDTINHGRLLANLETLKALLLLGFGKTLWIGPYFLAYL